VWQYKHIVGERLQTALSHPVSLCLCLSLGQPHVLHDVLILFAVSSSHAAPVLFLWM